MAERTMRIDGTAIARLAGVRSLLATVIGILIGQWLAFGATASPASLHSLGMSAAEGKDDAEALARLGHRQGAADAYRLTLRLEPSSTIARLALDGLDRIETSQAPAGARETVVLLEESRGVWIAPVVLNGSRPARFLVDTGSSVTLVSPVIGAEVVSHLGSRAAVPLQTLSGLTSGVTGRLASLRIGGVELHDVPVVQHDPGPGIDGILGNTVLG